jgi:hypothetical protein
MRNNYVAESAMLGKEMIGELFSKQEKNRNRNCNPGVKSKCEMTKVDLMIAWRPHGTELRLSSIGVGLVGWSIQDIGA